ncbi:MAG: hypothetical protein GY909_06990 [Oligoflexia bacterium]|nr:hypothetical protein [Oligoflexia bacterium]
METTENNDPIYKQYQLIYIVFVAFYVILNFIGSPTLKWNYMAIVAITIIGVVKFSWQQIILNLFFLFFIEGQGRILLGYNQISKVIFDFVIIIAIIKSYIVNKQIINLKKVPNFIYILITLHIAWYIFQIFNPDAASVFSVLGASKIYVFPFLMFFMFLINPLSPKDLERVHWVIIIATFVQVALSTFQMNLKENFLINLAPYYANIMSDRFTGYNFRPFGTTYAPGGPGVYLSYFSAFLLFSHSKKVLHKIILTVTILFSCFGLYIMQVRASLLKFVLIIAVAGLVKLLINKKNLKNTIISGIFIIGTLTATLMTVDLNKMFPDLDLTQASQRLLVFKDIDSLKGRRISFDKALNTIFRKLDHNPIGLGPGRTGGAVSLAKAKIMADPVYGIKSTWTFDNLFISLAIDLGWGMLFYTSIIIILPLYLFFKTIKFYIKGKGTEITAMALASVSLFVILVGNWGVIGIPYNPESFCFWLWCSIGLNNIYEIENTRI